MEKHMASSRKKKRVAYAARALTCMLLAAFLAVGTGCRDTDALKEIIIDQNSDIIDYDNPQKFYINDSTVEEENDTVSALEVSEEDPESDEVQNLIIYSSDPNSVGFTTKHSAFSNHPNFLGIEASDTVFFYQSDSVDAVDHEVTPSPDDQTPDEEEQEQLEQQWQESQNNSETSTTTVTNVVTTDLTNVTSTTNAATTSTTNTENASGAATNPGETGDGEVGEVNEGSAPVPEVAPEDNGAGINTDPEPEEEPEHPLDAPDGYGGGFTDTEGVGDWKNATAAFDPNNPDMDVPHYDSIAAFGDYALIVQMIGGAGALAATDAVTLSNLQTYGVATTALQGWNDDGSNPSDPTLVNVEAIVQSFGGDPGIILVEDVASYTTALSQEEYDYLINNGVAFGSLRSMNTSTYIKTNVNYVGEMLQDSYKAAYGATAQGRAEEYEEFHNRVVSEANQGLANDQGTDESSLSTRKPNTAFQTTNGKDGDTDGLGFSENFATYTTLVNYWDPYATLNLSYCTYDPGMAFAAVGCSSSPFSYYLQAGGTVNVAAAGTTWGALGEAPVVQDSKPESWSLDWITNAQLTNIYRSDTNLRTWGVTALLDSRYNTSSNTNIGYGLGSAVYPYLLVTDQYIKDSIVASSYSYNSCYHPNGFVAEATGLIWGCIGRKFNSGTILAWTAIGAEAEDVENYDGAPNTVFPEGYIYPQCILINPSGYFCDWTTGTVESFLEAGWTGARINGTYDYNQWQQDVIDFYSWAWGIGVNIAQIDRN